MYGILTLILGDFFRDVLAILHFMSWNCYWCGPNFQRYEVSDLPQPKRSIHWVGYIIATMAITMIVVSFFLMYNQKKNELINDNRDKIANDRLSKNIQDIKNALNESGFLYDSATNGIVNLNQSGSTLIGGIVGQGIGNSISGNTVNQPSFEFSNNNLDEILEAIKDTARQNNFSNKSIYIRIVKNTTGYRNLQAIYKMLDNNGYTINGVYTVAVSEADTIKRAKTGIGFDIVRKELVITLGDPF
jgi:hypothetical protein